MKVAKFFLLFFVFWGFGCKSGIETVKPQKSESGARWVLVPPPSNLPKRYHSPGQRVYVQVCDGCHQMRSISILAGDGKFTKNRIYPTPENVVKLLQTPGMHPIQFSNGELTSEELRGVAILVATHQY